MSTRRGPIVIIEDDEDDQEMMQEVLEEINVTNKIIFFNNCEEAMQYLVTTTDKPLLIISDVNLPGLSGIEMRKSINSNELLRRKSIPFIFITTSERPESIIQAYELMVQGYFIKPSSIMELKTMMQMIINYWLVCKHPNS